MVGSAKLNIGLGEVLSDAGRLSVQFHLRIPHLTNESITSPNA